jgi:hypothetical protein
VHRRPQHGDRLLVHDVTEVVGRRLQGGIVEIELAAQVLEVVAQRPPERGETPRRLEPEQRCSTCELAKIAARNAPSHVAPPWSVVRSISAPDLNELPRAAFAARHADRDREAREPANTTRAARVDGVNKGHSCRHSTSRICAVKHPGTFLPPPSAC